MTTNPTIQKANKLERAQDRLDRAIARLEGAARPSPPPPPQPPSVDPEAFAKAESDNRRLSDVQVQVERRLDATILKLKTLLED